MPIVTAGGFERMTGFCKTYIPKHISDKMAEIKGDDAAIKVCHAACNFANAMTMHPQAYGVELGVEMCRKMLDAGTPGLHMYTLNQETACLAILEKLGVLKQPAVVSPAKKEINGLADKVAATAVA